MTRARTALALSLTLAGCEGARIVGAAAPGAGAERTRQRDSGEGPLSEDAGPVDAEPVVPLPREVHPLPYDAEGAHKTAGTCAETTNATPVAFVSASRNLWLLVGRWRHCSGVSLSGDGAAVIELARSRRWYSLWTELTPGPETFTRSPHDGRWWLGAEDTAGTTLDPSRLLELFRPPNHDRYSFELFENPTTLRLALGPSTYVWLGE